MVEDGYQETPAFMDSKERNIKGDLHAAFKKECGFMKRRNK